MADGTKIEWTDATWNPITGCAIVSPGCTNCYAMKLAGTRLSHHASREGLTRDTKAGPVWTGEVRFNPQWLDQPFRWKKPRMIFVCAHGDLFAEGVPDEWIDQVFAVMALAPKHTFQVLTKRPERMRHYLRDGGLLDRLMGAACRIDSADGATWSADICIAGDSGLPLPNVWLGVSVEDQKRADERIPTLLDTPAAIRWISAEPLLGAVDIGRWVATAEVTCKQCNRAFWLHDANPCEHMDGGAWTLACPNCGDCRCKPGWTEADARTLDMMPPADWIDREVGRFTKVHPTISVTSLIDWVVVGGESGPGARPMHPDWARTLRDQCAAADVPVLFKQWGAFAPTRISLTEFWNPATARIGELVANPNGALEGCPAGPSMRRVGRKYAPGNITVMRRVGKKSAGRLLDGIEHNGFPEIRR